jgi:hypothetical protein
MPVRVMRSRARGWRMPPNTVFVGRPTRWGNPFDWRNGLEVGDEPWARAAAAQLFRDWLFGRVKPADIGAPPTLDQIAAALAGKNLACWCPLDQPCHADVLLIVARGVNR